MSDRHTSNDAGPAWERRNAGRERLKALADSINDTARMARATLSLLLVVALYLGFTLLSSNDENLILNAEVVVLQIGSGIALEQSYAFGPGAFLYLHLQALFLLIILHRKMENFNTVLGQESNNLQRGRQEYWNWLSAFALVQQLRPDRSFRLSSRFLMWTSTEAIPLVLLFIVTLSFVRYQSESITCIHKLIFMLDLVSVIVFNFSISGIHLHPLRELPNQVALRWKRQKCIWIRIRILFRAALAILMTLVLLIWATPPIFDFESYKGNSKPLWEIMKEKRSLIWRTDANDQEMRQESIRHTNADGQQSTSMEEMRRSIRLANKNSRWSAPLWPPPLWIWVRENNVLDAVPCEWWGFACRYLDAKDLWLVITRPNSVPVSKDHISSDADPEEAQWFHINSLSLSRRNLRFADFRHAQLQGANLESAELQGANLEGGNLQDAVLTRTLMHGALLLHADLREAELEGAHLQGANLTRTKSQSANFEDAQLQNVSLKDADLQEASLLEAELQDADMKSARLDDARLRGANLEGAVLEEASLLGAGLRHVRLRGANLRDAQLQGANLQNAKLLDVYLEGAQLEGVDFNDVEIRGSIGTPESSDLAWMAYVSSDYDSSKSDTASYSKQCEKPTSPLETYILDLNLARQSRPGLSLWIPSEYWDRLADWTAEFACRNKYTARSSWRRWNDEDPLTGMKELVSEKTIIQVKRRILQLILSGQGCEECAGLRDISDDQRKRWRREFVEVRSAASWMPSVRDVHPVCGEWHNTKSTGERPTQ